MTFTDKYFDLGGAVYFYNKVATMPKTKENAFVHFCAMICRSWTFDHMTHEEKTRCISALRWTANQNALRGNFSARWIILQAVYNAFLSGLGYDGPKWREANEE